MTHSTSASEATPSPSAGEGGGGAAPAHDSQTAQAASTHATHVTVNGEARRLPPGTAVGALMEGADALGSAIARNREVVPRSHWDDVLLTDGDTIEIVRPTQGG